MGIDGASYIGHHQQRRMRAFSVYTLISFVAALHVGHARNCEVVVNLEGKYKDTFTAASSADGESISVTASIQEEELVITAVDVPGTPPNTYFEADNIMPGTDFYREL